MDEITEIVGNGQEAGDLLDEYVVGDLRGLGPDSGARSSVDDVYDQILQRILRGEIASGETLVCTQLANELSVSRTPVVGAIDRLVSDGILVKEKNHLARVNGSAENWLAQIHQLREVVEPPAAGLAAKHMTSETMQKLQELAKFATPDGHDAWQQAARAFDCAIHISIADHCHNMPLRETIHRCWRSNRISYQLGYFSPNLEEVGHREHLAILSALLQRDSETAVAAMMFHLRSSMCRGKTRKIS